MERECGEGKREDKKEGENKNTERYPPRIQGAATATGLESSHNHWGEATEPSSRGSLQLFHKQTDARNLQKV